MMHSILAYMCLTRRMRHVQAQRILAAVMARGIRY